VEANLNRRSLWALLVSAQLFEFKAIVDQLGSACYLWPPLSFSSLTTVIMQPKQQAKKETCKPCGTSQGDKAKANTAKPDAKVDPK
jgi:hypothetical protein